MMCTTSRMGINARFAAAILCGYFLGGGQVVAQQDSTSPDFEIEMIRGFSAKSLTDWRRLCVSGGVNSIRHEYIKRKAKFPEIFELCLRVLEEASERNYGWYLYIDMYLRKHGISLFDSKTDEINIGEKALGLIARNGHIAMFNSIRKAALNGGGQYLSEDGRLVRFDCPLAYDVGFVYGFFHPEDVVSRNFPRQSKISNISICYNLTRNNVLIKGRKYKLTRVGYVTGEQRGKEYYGEWLNKRLSVIK